MTVGMQIQKEAVNCGYWPLYHFDPRNETHPFHLDSKKPVGDYKEFAMKEARFNILTRSKPEAAAQLFRLAQDDINDRWHLYEQLAGVEHLAGNGGEAAARRHRPGTNPNEERGESMSVDLSTTYLGLKLKNPLVIAASPMTQKLDSLITLEEKGAAAAVFPSLFEEQVEHDTSEMTKLHEFGTESFAEALSYFPEEDDFHVGPESYLEAISKAKKAVTIPVIASLNGTSKGGWVRYAKMMQDAGADALELNIYFIAADLDMTGRDVEVPLLRPRVRGEGIGFDPAGGEDRALFQRHGQHGQAAGGRGGRRPGVVQPFPPARLRPGHAGDAAEARLEHAL